MAAQSKPELALVVVDDHSTDGGERSAVQWLQQNGERFSSAELLRHPQNLGLASARNTAITRATTAFVFVLDADNALYPRALERLEEALAESDAAFTYSILEQFGDATGIVGCDAWSREALGRGNYIDAMALLRRSVWEDLGGYRRMQTGGWEDYDFWCRCAEAGLEGLQVPELLCRYRVHGRSMLRSSTDRLREHLDVCRELRDSHPWIAI